MRLLMYGAGNIGRGFIGAIFAAADYEVVFVDVDTEIVHALNEKHRYTVQIAAIPPYEMQVSNVRAVDGRDIEKVIHEIVNCDVMATALGVSVLPLVSPVIAKGFAERIRKNNRALDILICENLKNSGIFLKALIEKNLPEPMHDIMENKLGLVETAIGRMVPVLSEEEKKTDPLLVRVEKYDFLPVDRIAFCGSVPDIPQLVPHDPFVYYEDRKLYLHNMAHCICAFLGLKAGCTYIWEAIQDTRIRLLVQGAMQESCMMLSDTYQIPFYELQKHADDLLFRFSNRALADTCERVARDPERKIGEDDRLAAPLRHCLSINIFAVHIAAGLAQVLLSINISSDELDDVLKNNCGLTGQSFELVKDLYNEFTEFISLEKYICIIDEYKKINRGKII